MKPAIEVRNLSKSYIINHKNKASYSTVKDDLAKIIRNPFGGPTLEEKQETFWALDDVSFDVKKGEIFGIIGRNGSGKSTMLKILSNIVEPTRGKAIMRGRAASLLEVGTGFNPELTGRENIFFNGSMLGMSRREIIRKFDEIVEFSEVEKFLDTPVKFYSSGMYVRLAFSVAAHLEPDILILDEVLSVGDEGFQKKSLKKILSTIEDGRTVLFVSHSMGSVQQLCNRGLLLNAGKVEFIGETDELTARYVDIVQNELPPETINPIWEHKDGHASNDYFKLKKITLTNNAGKIIDKPVKSSQETWVNFDLEIKNASKDLMIGYALHTKSRSLLYFSYSGDQPSKQAIKFTKGLQTLSAKLPKELLNEGDYKVSIVASIHNKFWIFEPGSGSNPAVELLVRGGLIHDEYWKGPRDGVLAPNIEWKIR